MQSRHLFLMAARKTLSGLFTEQPARNVYRPQSTAVHRSTSPGCPFAHQRHFSRMALSGCQVNCLYPRFFIVQGHTSVLDRVGRPGRREPPQGVARAAGGGLLSSSRAHGAGGIP